MSDMNVVSKRELDWGHPGCLQARKADEVGTETEARTLARREANGRRQEVQERERDGGDDRDGEHLLHIQLLLGDDEGRQRDGETLEEILDGACNELCNCEAVHLILRGWIFVGIT